MGVTQFQRLDPVMDVSAAIQRQELWMFVSSSVSIECFAAACGRYWRGAPRAECIVDSVPVGKQHRALIVQIEQKSLEVPQSQYPEQVLDVLVVTQQP